MAEIVNIHGKNYETVASRVQRFRDKYKIEDGWSLTCEVMELTQEKVVMKASVKNPDGVVVGTGYSEEKRASSYINKLSALENCETSAIGRAIAFCGFSGNTQICSQEELQTKTQSSQAQQLQKHQQQNDRKRQAVQQGQKPQQHKPKQPAERYTKEWSQERR